MVFSKDITKVKIYDYKLFSYTFEYTNGSIETVDDPSKYRFNNFIDMNYNNNDDLNELIIQMELKSNIVLFMD